MKQYRKRPIVIEAVQFTGKNENEIEWWGGRKIEIGSYAPGGTPKPYLRIKTLAGEMIAEVNDWIIRGIKGEFYPCKPDIFKATYEEVADG